MRQYKLGWVPNGTSSCFLSAWDVRRTQRARDCVFTGAWFKIGIPA